jgi:hypothetical protein
MRYGGVEEAAKRHLGHALQDVFAQVRVPRDFGQLRLDIGRIH